MFARHRLPGLFFSLLLAIGSAAISQAAFAQAVDNGVLPPGTSGGPKGPSILGPVPVSGQWIEFAVVGPAGTFATGCYPADPAAPQCIPSSAGNSVFGDAPPWTFTAPPQGATLTVTDAFLYGDVFEVFDFGVSIGTTSAPGSGISCGDNPDVCLADPLASHGVFPLKSGPHQITIKATVSPIGATAAYFRVDPGELKPDHFVCYKVTPKDEKGRKHKDGKHEKLKVLVTNQFGEQVLIVDDPELLCVPSTKEVLDQMPPGDDKAPQ